MSPRPWNLDLKPCLVPLSTKYLISKTIFARSRLLQRVYSVHYQLFCTRQPYTKRLDYHFVSKLFFFRTLQSIFTLFDLYLSHPLPQRVSFIRKITTTVASVPGSFDLLFTIRLHITKAPSAREIRFQHPHHQSRSILCSSTSMGTASLSVMPATTHAGPQQ